MTSPDIQLVVLDVAGTTVRDDDAVNTCLREALAPLIAISRDALFPPLPFAPNPAPDLLYSRINLFYHCL